VAGPREPQQTRSREALRRILRAAEEVLAADGFDDFTMAAVAERSGVSIGGIYRRFDSKVQLVAAVKDRVLTRVEDNIGERLRRSGPGLTDVVGGYAHAPAEALDENRAFFPDLMIPRSDEMSDRGLPAVHEVERLFAQAATPHLAEVRRAEPEAALGVAGRVITGTCLQSCARGDMPDRAAWARLAGELSAMAVAYLLTADPP
jgi:AcrR family transcriptional regulator